MKNDFVITLSRIIGEIKPDRIIFEPSGIFVPDEIIDMLKSPEFSSTCVLNSLITVVDCVNFLKQRMKFSFFFERQITNATLLLLSKTQLVPAPIITEVVDKLSLINKQAKIISIDWSGIDSNNIFGLLESEEKSDIDILLHSESCNCGSHQHHSQCNHNYSHNDEFDTFSLKTSRVFNLDDLEVALHKLTSNEYGDILRGKGFIKADKGFHEFSYTNGQFTISNYSKETSARVCLIGKNLDKAKLRSAFEI